MPIPDAVQQEFNEALDAYTAELNTAMGQHFAMDLNADKPVSVSAGGPGSGRHKQYGDAVALLHRAGFVHQSEGMNGYEVHSTEPNGAGDVVKMHPKNLSWSSKEKTFGTSSGSASGKGLFSLNKRFPRHVHAGGPGSGRYPAGSSGNGLGRNKTGRVFVSPNVEEGTNLDQAKQALASDRQKNFENKLKEIGSSVIGKNSYVGASIGVWSDGAENSTELHTTSTNRDARRYAAALAGSAANQKAVLDWENQKDGPHTLYAIRSKESGDTLNSKIEASGIEHRTVEASPDGKSSTAFVLDQDGTLGDKISKLAKDNGYGIQSKKGTGDFIGSWNTREEGQQAYSKIIKDYEAKHPEKSFKSDLRFVGLRDGEPTGAGGFGSNFHRNRGIQTPAGQDVQARLAARMKAGYYRVIAGESELLVITNKPMLAANCAMRASAAKKVVQIYDHSGTVVYVTGGGQHMPFPEGFK